MNNQNKINFILEKYHINNPDQLESILKSYIPLKYHIGDEVYVLDTSDLRKSK